MLEERVFRTAHCACVFTFLLVEGIATFVQGIDLPNVSPTGSELRITCMATSDQAAVSSSFSMPWITNLLLALFFIVVVLLYAICRA